MTSLLLLLLLPAAAQTPAKIVSLRTFPAQATLSGARATQQFAAVVTDSDGVERDVTAEASWSLSRPVLAKFASEARIAPLGNGALEVRAEFAGLKAQSSVGIKNANTVEPLNFARDIGAIFTKRGCNSSACHGGVKGRGGFKLSANALHPAEDHEWIVKGGTYQVLTSEVKGERVPRVNLAAPEQSLLLTKPAMIVPHGGGNRLEKDSVDYHALLAWIRGGAPFQEDARPAARLEKLSFQPPVAILADGGKQRLLVNAHFSDGHVEDFTNQVIYSSNDGNVATVRADGIIEAKSRGETAILVKAAGQMASVVVGVIGPRIRHYPKTPRVNFIDEHVFRKLEKFQIIPSDISGDATFLRRVCLDLTGTLPPPERVREFLASKDPAKRDKVIDALLASPEYVDYWTFRFADIFRVAIFTNGLSSKWSQSYWEWIRDNVEQDRPYDQVARERIAAQGYEPASRHFLPYALIGPPAEMMAEEVRVFFGRRLDCAQCHNHPY